MADFFDPSKPVSSGNDPSKKKFADETSLTTIERLDYEAKLRIDFGETFFSNEAPERVKFYQKIGISTVFATPVPPLAPLETGPQIAERKNNEEASRADSISRLQAYFASLTNPQLIAEYKRYIGEPTQFNPIPANDKFAGLLYDEYLKRRQEGRLAVGGIDLDPINTKLNVIGAAVGAIMSQITPQVGQGPSNLPVVQPPGPAIGGPVNPGGPVIGMPGVPLPGKPGALIKPPPGQQQPGPLPGAFPDNLFKLNPPDP